MRDSVLPLSVSPSQLYNFGNSGASEVQVMPSLDISSFCWDSIAFGNYQLDPPPVLPLPAAAGFHITPHYQQQQCFNVTSYDDPQFEAAAAAAWYGYSPFSACDGTTSSSESMVVTNKLTTSAAAIENGLYSKQGRKRSVEVSSTIATKSNTATGKRKKSSTATSAGAWHHHHHHQQVNDQSIAIQEFKVPVRRSQKLSDKITALQKLVSPYGKTDTASVLQEASLYIKLLQKQIQMLSNIASSSSADDDSNNEASWTTTIEESHGELLDLRNRGLCLVPLSMTKKLAAQCLAMDPSPYPGDQAEA